jgi:hypothetical protein
MIATSRWRPTWDQMHHYEIGSSGQPPLDDPPKCPWESPCKRLARGRDAVPVYSKCQGWILNARAGCRFQHWVSTILPPLVPEALTLVQASLAAAEAAEVSAAKDHAKA